MSARVLARGDERAPRCAVVAGRLLGGAVVRNRAKRRLREAVREVGLAPGVDVVLIARADAVSLDFPALKADVERTLAKAAAT